MPDREEQANGFQQQLLSVLESLRPGVRQLSDTQEAVIAEYEHTLEQLAGPSFSPPAPQITDFDTDDAKVRIFGKHLRDAMVVHVGGVRVPNARFQLKDAEEPYIEADVPEGAIGGPITVLTSGGLATSRGHFRAEDSPAGSASKAEAWARVQARYQTEPAETEAEPAAVEGAEESSAAVTDPGREPGSAAEESEQAAPAPESGAPTTERKSRRKDQGAD